MPSSVFFLSSSGSEGPHGAPRLARSPDGNLHFGERPASRRARPVISEEDPAGARRWPEAPSRRRRHPVAPGQGRARTDTGAVTRRDWRARRARNEDPDQICVAVRWFIPVAVGPAHPGGVIVVPTAATDHAGCLSGTGVFTRRVVGADLVRGRSGPRPKPGSAPTPRSRARPCRVRWGTCAATGSCARPQDAAIRVCERALAQSPRVGERPRARRAGPSRRRKAGGGEWASSDREVDEVAVTHTLGATDRDGQVIARHVA